MAGLENDHCKQVKNNFEYFAKKYYEEVECFYFDIQKVPALKEDMQINYVPWGYLQYLGKEKAQFGVEINPDRL